MRGKFMRGITTGALIGMAAGIIMVPSMDRGTKRRIRRTTKTFMNRAEDAFGTMRNSMR